MVSHRNVLLSTRPSLTQCDPFPSLLSTLDAKRIISFIVKGVELNQKRLISRAVRLNTGVRKGLTPAVLKTVIEKKVPATCPTFAMLYSTVEKLEAAVPSIEVNGLDMTANGNANGSSEGDDMDVDGEASGDVEDDMPPRNILPEVEVYIFNLVLTGLLRAGLVADALAVAPAMMARVKTFNRRSLDLICGKFFSYYSLCFERAGCLSAARPELLVTYRRACVRHDEMCQAVLLNLILRNFLHYNLYEQADTLSSKAPFPEGASNNQLCRYLYYMGRVAALQLEYGDAHMKLLQASRKAPDMAVAFVTEVTQLSIIVQLLMGDVPAAAVFHSDPRSAAALAPYEELTLAVRKGDLAVFSDVASRHADLFKQHKNYSLVKRLQHNVLKTGLRKISISYARISIADVAAKLGMSSLRGMEYICAKAIRDGVINASLDHENGWLCSEDSGDVYESETPQQTLHRRIAFCMEVHNEAVKSMRYPPDVYKRSKTDESKGAEDQEKTIEELIEEMENDGDEL